MLDNSRIEEDAYDLVSRYENRLLDIDGRFDRAKSCAILNAVSIIEAFKKATVARDLQIAYVNHWTAVISAIMKMKEMK